jgi:hypothetical protein
MFNFLPVNFTTRSFDSSFLNFADFRVQKNAHNNYHFFLNLQLILLEALKARSGHAKLVFQVINLKKLALISDQCIHLGLHI